MIKSLAVNIITYNGASSFIIEAIEAVKPYASEILIIDNGSTDGTMNLVKKKFPGIKIGRIGSYDIFKKAGPLNILKKWSTAEWILRIDDDEIFPKETMEEIMNIDQVVPVYSIPFLHYEDGGFVDPNSHKKNTFCVARLFKNIPEITWVRQEEVLAYNNHPISSRANQPTLCRKLNNPFLHFGNLRSNRPTNYHFHEQGHCHIPVGDFVKYVPKKN